MSTPVLLLAAGCYALLFWGVAAWKPRWALLLIFAAAPFQMDVSGSGPFRFSFAEVNLFLSLPLVLFRSRRVHFGPTLLPALLYLGVGLFSALGQWRSSTLISFIQAGVFIIVLPTVFASFAKREDDYLLAFNGLILVGIFLALSVLGTGSSYVYGLHKNGVGASLASTFVVALELWLGAKPGRTRWFYLVACAVLASGCLVTVSRGAWMTAVVGALAILAVRGRLGMALKCALVLVPLVAVLWRFLPEDSRTYATGFGEERSNIKARYDSIDYAMSLFYANPVQGAGLGLRKDFDATNVIILCLGETGVPGLLTFLALNSAVVVMVFGAYRRIPRGTLGSSVLAIAVGLILGKFMHGLVDHYWSRGSLTVGWAAVGMAARVIYDQRRERKRLALERAMAAQETQEQAELEAEAVPAGSAPTHRAREGGR